MKHKNIFILSVLVLAFELGTLNPFAQNNCQPTMVTNELDSAGKPCTGTGCGTAMNWRDCSVTCGNLTYNNYSDWRMPTVSEWGVLINVAPGNTSDHWVWTATQSSGDRVVYWIVLKEKNGHDGSAKYSKELNCRCVR